MLTFHFNISLSGNLTVILCAYISCSLPLNNFLLIIFNFSASLLSIGRKTKNALRGCARNRPLLKKYYFLWMRIFQWHVILQIKTILKWFLLLVIISFYSRQILTENKHIEMCSIVVGYIMKKWRRYKNFIMDDEFYGWHISRVTDDKRVMSHNRQKVEHAGLHSVFVLFSNRVDRVNSDVINTNYGSGLIINNLLFSSDGSSIITVLFLIFINLYILVGSQF